MLDIVNDFSIPCHVPRNEAVLHLLNDAVLRQGIKNRLFKRYRSSNL